MPLFQGSPISELLHRSLQTAVSEVEGLGVTELGNPAIAGWIETLWAKHRPDVPVIFPTQRSGDTREEREERNDYGRRVIVTVTYVDVSVPFQGSSDLFRVRPSTTRVINEDIRMGHGCLICSLPLDDASTEKIDKVFAMVEGNLQQMRNDVGCFDKTALEQLSRLAAERKAKLQANAEKMKKLGL
jgi:hypothetical protein